MNAEHLSPEPIIRPTIGFMAARLLGVAVELRVFEILGTGGADQEALAEKVGVPPERLRVLLNAMVGIGLLAQQGDTYRCTPVATTYLAEDTEADLRPFVRFMHRMRYESWLRLEEVLHAGADAVEQRVLSLEEQANVSEGIAAVTYPSARALAAHYDFSRHKHMLDLGGGTGSFLVPTLSRHPTLRATLLDHAEVAQLARQRLSDAGLSDRVTIQSGDFFTCQLPSDADVILMANVVHIFSPPPQSPVAGAAAAVRFARSTPVAGGFLDR